MRIQDVLAAKPTQSVYTIRPDAPAQDVVSKLAEFNIGALIVSSDGRDVLGVVSERDIVRHLRTAENLQGTTVATLMTALVHTSRPQDDLGGVMAAMTEHRIRHVPVLVDGELVGIISIGDVVKARMGELEFERDQLGQFITSQQS